jgi:hypothetical protein
MEMDMFEKKIFGKGCASRSLHVYSAFLDLLSITHSPPYPHSPSPSFLSPPPRVDNHGSTQKGSEACCKISQISQIIQISPKECSSCIRPKFCNKPLASPEICLLHAKSRRVRVLVRVLMQTSSRAAAN